MVVTTRATFVLRLGILLSTMAGTLSSSVSQTSSCAVVGAGVLGASLCRQILEDPLLAHVKVTGITKTSNRHASIREQVLSGVTVESANERFDLKLSDELSDSDKFENVVFCAPPSGFEDYPKAVHDAAKNVWAGPSAGGVFVFTSSGCVYSQDSGVVSAATPVPSSSEAGPRAARLLGAEEACLSEEGCCIRLAGLYNLQRGAHNYWLTSGKEIAGSRNGLINLLHYDDAAGVCLAALKAESDKCRGNIFIASDSNPITRLQICESALKAACYKDLKIPPFAVEATGEPFGKTYDCTETYSQLNWKPKYESFDAFMTANA